MNKKEKILESLNTVAIEGITRSLVEMNLVREIKIEDKVVDITIAAENVPVIGNDNYKRRIEEALKGNGGIENARIEYVDGKPQQVNEVKNVIAVMSGKGGVGKSLVAGLLAVALRRRGYQVGILDGDITGPSIPKMFGLKGLPIAGENGMLPALSKTGIGVMSINLLLPNEDDAVIWRGPLIGKAITQFWEEVYWGKLDYLIVDLPPGTADAPLTVLKTLPVSGTVIIFTPQGLTKMIVRKAVQMAKNMDIPVLGVVENMSYLYIPEIDKKIEVFGESNADKMADSSGAPLLAQIPIDTHLAKLCDDGNVEDYQSDVIEALGKSINLKKGEAKK